MSTHLPPGLTPDQVTRLGRVADTCPVKRAFEAGFSFEPKLVRDLSTVAGKGESARSLRHAAAA